MKRLFAALILLPFPALAWDATIGPVCTLTHASGEAEIALSYDPSLPLYSITVTRGGDGWRDAQTFGMQFFGPRPNMITTNRHQLGDGDRSLTVTDRGFGNVLDGLQFNESVTAFTSAGQTVTVSLDGAAPAVQAFRDCTEAGLV